MIDQLLIFKKPRTLSKQERKALVQVCKHRTLPDQYRKYLWLRGSGAVSMMNLPENKDYYKKLRDTGLDYPSPSIHQIEVDLNRTFGELEIEHSESMINKLRNVLTAYTKRNALTSYCQGMNFIAGRLLKATSITNPDVAQDHLS